MKILHVEEAPDGLDLVRRILSEAGHRMLGALDGSEGIEVALREQPDLILLDLGLPGVDGCEVGAAMRLFPALQSPVIVVIVPVSEARRHEERVFAAGCNGYVTRPIDPDRLAQQIERFQRARRDWVDPGRPAPLLRDLHRGIVQKLLGQVQEQKRATRGLSERGALLESLQQIGELSASNVGLRGLTDEVLPGVARSLGFSAIAVSLLDRSGGGEWAAAAPDTLEAEGPAGRFDVPLTIQGRVIGRLLARASPAGPEPRVAAALLRLVASQVAAAVENARLREGLGRQAEDLGHTAAQLLQSAKLAAIREVAAEVAHEINNPMTSILGYATLLYEETSDESPRKETLRLIQSESLRIREIVRTLLDFSGRRSLSLATGSDPCPSAVDAR